MLAMLALHDADMPYREKLAWAGLISLLLFYGAYFLFAPIDEPQTTLGLLRRLGGFAAATAGRGIAWGAVALLLMWKTPAGDRLGPDERDRAIRRRGASMAYGALITGMILVGIVMPFSDKGWRIINAALLAIAAAEAVRLAAIILSYRRGWHG